LILFLAGIGGIAWVVSRVIADDRNTKLAAAAKRAFEKALEENRIDAAYAMTTPQFQQRVSRDAFRESINRHPALIAPPGTRWSKDERGLPNKFGVPEFPFETEITNGGQTISFAYVVIVKDGVAKVDSFEFRR
jgi:hypothetical protein